MQKSTPNAKDTQLRIYFAIIHHNLPLELLSLQARVASSTHSVWSANCNSTCAHQEPYAPTKQTGLVWKSAGWLLGPQRCSPPEDIVFNMVGMVGLKRWKMSRYHVMAMLLTMPMITKQNPTYRSSSAGRARRGRGGATRCAIEGLHSVRAFDTLPHKNTSHKHIPFIHAGSTAALPLPAMAPPQAYGVRLANKTVLSSVTCQNTSDSRNQNSSTKWLSFLLKTD